MNSDGVIGPASYVQKLGSKLGGTVRGDAWNCSTLLTGDKKATPTAPSDHTHEYVTAEIRYSISLQLPAIGSGVEGLGV